jgi:hypothetical protein
MDDRSGATVTGPGTGTATVIVQARRCTACGRVNHHSLFGVRAARRAERARACPACGAEAWDWIDVVAPW